MRLNLWVIERLACRLLSFQGFCTILGGGRLHVDVGLRTVHELCATVMVSSFVIRGMRIHKNRPYLYRDAALAEAI